MLLLIHGRLATTVVLFALALGVWAAFGFFRKDQVSPSYRGALIIGELLMLLQALFGVLMVLVGTLPADLLHIMYGALVALSWPAVYVYTNARMGRTELGYYSLASFLICGLALRAIMTS
ncbi:MAG: hypothetical protein M1570_01590 [Chloroflexi bacterium]|nr:hypothetical protein [Chloroflexota bacterium]